MSAPLAADDAMDGLADILLRGGQCDARALERCRRLAEDSGQRLDAVLIQLGLVTERGLAEAYARLVGQALTTADRYPRDVPLFADRLSARFLRQARALPLAVQDDTLVLAVVDPLDPFTAAAVAAATGHRVVQEVAIPIELDAALDRLYPREQADHAGDASEQGEALEDDSERLKDLASEAPVIRLVNQLITRAAESRASDIHIEPFEDRLRVRYRYDGVLHDVDTQPPRLAPAIISRVKIMARLDIAERRLPQDGRIRLVVRGQETDLRVATVPSLHGESVVMRVLDRAAVALDYARLGLAPQVIERFSAALELPDGIVLVSGPTGSGKTTTLYTGLLALNAVSRKIITLEDPIEFQLRGITQIQVRTQIGLDFPNLLRSVVRLDPDVIMVGEIRDPATAQIAMQAALTGHIVLSTLHTNSAAGAVTRLRDMGVEDYLLTAVMRGVLAQRLVRRLCANCRQPIAGTPDLMRRFDLRRHAGDRPVMLCRPVGCPQCHQTGYRGRFAIAEFLEPNPEIEHLIFQRADHGKIERAAVEAGMTTMFEAGLAASVAGETTIEEVLRSVRAEA